METCDIRLSFLDPNAPLIAASIDEVTIEEQSAPPRFTDFSDVSSRDLLTGVLNSIVELDDGTIVVSHSPGQSECSRPIGQAATELVFINPETMTVDNVVTAPPCLRKLVRVPQAAGGFIGLHLDRSGWVVSRFDNSGTISTRIITPTNDGRGLPPYAVGTHFTTQGTLIVGFSLDSEMSTDDLSFWLYEIDLVTEEIVRSKTGNYGQTFHISRIDDATIAVGFEVVSNYELGRIGFDTEDELLDLNILNPSSLTHSAYHAPTGRMVHALTQDEPSIQIQKEDNLTEVNFLERPTQPSLFLPWPNSDLMLVAGTTRDQETGEGYATLNLLDVAQARVLPGTRLLGDSVISEGLVDSQGRIWLMMPWNGTVTRVSPARN